MRTLLTLLLLLLSAFFTFAQEAKLNKDYVLRGTASESGVAVTKIDDGSKGWILMQSGDWYLIQTKEYVGWVPSRVLKIKSKAADVRQAPAEPTEVSIETLSSPPIESTVPPESRPLVTTTPVSAVAAQPSASGKCKDGTLTYSQTKQGACSDHGGVDDWYLREASTTAPDASSGPKTVQVKGYYRKDGTYVKPHTRSAPRKH